MAIDFDSDPGGLFSRIGRLLFSLNSVNDFRGTAGTPNLETAIDDIEAQYAASDQNLTDALYTQKTSYRSSHASFLQYLRSLAQSTVIEMADDDASLASKDIATALKEVIAQMVDGSYDIEKPIVTVSDTAGSSNTGQGQLVGSAKNVYGVTRDYVFAETIRCLCTNDSQLGATEGREPFSVRGEVAASDQLSHDWPAGSGASISIQAVDADEDAGTNKLTNGAFTSFTSNIPDNWAVLVGAAATDIFSAGSSDALGSAGSALKFTGTGGAPLSSVAQTFNTSSGTTATLKPNTVYHYSFWAKKSAGLAAGVIEVGLVDGSNAAISDDASTANTHTIAHGSLTTSYAHFSGAFITPKSLPTTYKIRARVSTALTSAESAFIDHLTLTEATQVYQGGPYVTIHSHPTYFIVNDSFSLVVANDYGSLFALGLERLFDLRAKGLQFPSVSGGGEEIDDGLLS